MKKGLLIVLTGNGKGKTTSALGMAFRAMGHGLKVCIIQFIKGSWKYGELESAKRFSDLLDFYVLGKGFTWQSENLEEDIKIAREAWDFAKETINSNKYEMVILDELTYLIKYKMVSEEEIVNFLLNRPENLTVVVTGRDASKLLIDSADLVTEMVSIKHPYDVGVKAQKGIEF
ncbi:TPA: cob(I)yrinic acid a,c-diamide adenosyltransferase [Candidatus Poribacteria bacterium]|nr:cob(I)yrinic acid a,c-diamide adenosyltransferase [Candidatus Poribacteria bacterium]